MRSPEHLFMEFLPSAIQPFVIAGAIIGVALTVGLILLAITIRGEDAETSLGVHAPGPIARSVRHMLSLHVYTGDTVSKRWPDDRRSEAAYPGTTTVHPEPSSDPSRSRSVMLTSVAPDDRGQREVRAWVTWDEHDQRLAGPRYGYDSQDYYPGPGHYHGPA